MPKVSIIVPVYKVEQYLTRCVDSILNQSFTDFECILVDDGSPDKCPQICDEYARKDSRIKVIHKQNGGLSDARNAGIEIAKGEYLSFVDSDDWIHPQMIEILYKLIPENKVLISICNYSELERKTEFKHVIYEEINRSLERKNGMDFLIKDNDVRAVVAWGKLYHRSLFDEIRYPYGKLHEDEFVAHELMHKAGEVVVCSEKLYYYYINADGITRAAYNIKRTDAIEAMERRKKFLKENGLDRYLPMLEKQMMYIVCFNYKQINKMPQYKRESDKLKRKIRKILLFRVKRSELRLASNEVLYKKMFPYTYKFMYAWEKALVAYDIVRYKGIGNLLCRLNKRKR